MQHHKCDLPETQVFRLDHAVFIVCESEPEPPPLDPPPRTYHEGRVRALIKLGPLVERVLRRNHVARADVPDLTQNVLLDLLTWWAMQDGAPVLAIRAYAAAVARRAAYRYHHRNRRRRERTDAHDSPALAPNERHEGEEPRAPAEPSPEEAAVEAEARAELAAEVNLDALAAATSPAFWRAFYGYFVLHVPVETIAEAEHVPAATIYNRLRLARQDLSASVRRRRAAKRR